MRATGAPTRGRPRHHEPAAERQLLIDAATAVLRRNDFRGATLQEILDECGLSTRACYRHFASKPALLRAVQLRDAERAAERMSVRMAGAADPWEAVTRWVDEMAGIVFDQRRARRIEVLAAEVTQASTDRDQLAATMTAPLATTLAAGRRSGALTTIHPAEDAATIFAICADALRQCREHRASWTRRRMVEHVLRFCRAALSPAE